MKTKRKKARTRRIRPLRVSAPVLDMALVEDSSSVCTVCHRHIIKRKGVSFGKPVSVSPLFADIPPLFADIPSADSPRAVCEVCLNFSVSFIESAKEGLI